MGDWVHGAQLPGFEAFHKAGIPMIEINSDPTTYKGDGALLYIGSDEVNDGIAAGKAMIAAGARTVLYPNSLPGSPAAESRNVGIREAVTAAGGKEIELELSASTVGDPTAVTEAIRGTLLKNPKIDGVVGSSAQSADYAYAAIQQAGLASKVRLGGFDDDTTTLTRIAKGQQFFAIDSQPYLQGYYSVVIALQYIKYGFLPGMSEILTGPLVITKANVAQALKNASAGLAEAAS